MYDKNITPQDVRIMLFIKYNIRFPPKKCFFAQQVNTYLNSNFDVAIIIVYCMLSVY